MTDRHNLHLKLFIYPLESKHLGRALRAALGTHQFHIFKEFADIGSMQWVPSRRKVRINLDFLLKPSTFLIFSTVT